MKRENIYVGKNIQKSANGFRQSVNDPLKTASMAVLFCITDEQSLQEAEQTAEKIKNEYAQTDIIQVFSSDRKGGHPFDEENIVINKSHFNLFGNLKKSVKNRLQNYKYDLLIALPDIPDDRCKKVISQIDSVIKAGKSFDRSEELFNFIIGNKNRKLDNETFFTQLKLYLKQLHINFTVVNN